MTDRQRHGFILLLVAGLIAASFVLIATKKTRLGLDLKGGVELVYRAEPTPESPVNQASLQRAVDVMNNRVNQLGVTQPQITTEGKNLIDVQLPDVKNVAQAEKTVGTTAQLFFYDWEANVLTPTGQPAASGLDAADAAFARAQPGQPATCRLDLTARPPARWASTRPCSSPPSSRSRPSSKKLSAAGNEFFMFGAPGSSACAACCRGDGHQGAEGRPLPDRRSAAGSDIDVDRAGDGSAEDGTVAG